MIPRKNGLCEGQGSRGKSVVYDFIDPLRRLAYACMQTPIRGQPIAGNTKVRNTLPTEINAVAHEVEAMLLVAVTNPALPSAISAEWKI